MIEPKLDTDQAKKILGKYLHQNRFRLKPNPDDDIRNRLLQQLIKHSDTKQAAKTKFASDFIYKIIKAWRSNSIRMSINKAQALDPQLPFPEEILLEILKYLDLQSLLHLRSKNRFIYQFIQKYWKQFYLNYFGDRFVLFSFKVKLIEKSFEIVGIFDPDNTLKMFSQLYPMVVFSGQGIAELERIIKVNLSPELKLKRVLNLFCNTLIHFDSLLNIHYYVDGCIQSNFEPKEIYEFEDDYFEIVIREKLPYLICSRESFSGSGWYININLNKKSLDRNQSQRIEQVLKNVFGIIFDNQIQEKRTVIKQLLKSIKMDTVIEYKEDVIEYNEDDTIASYR